MRKIYYMIAITRIASPFLIFVSPLVGGITNLLLDIGDGPVAYRSKLKWGRYNLIDKLLDNWWYLIITLYMLSSPLRFVFMGLLLYRLLALPIVHLTKNERLYIIFPNVLEWLFYLFIIWPSSANSLAAFVFCLAISLIVEWNTHIGKTSLIAKTIFRTNMKWKI